MTKSLAPGLYCLAIIAGLNIYAPGELTTLERILASTIILIAFAGMQRWKRTNDFGFFPILMVMYVLFFAVPIFTELTITAGIFSLYPGDRAMEEALFLTILGLTCIILGYFGSRKLRIPTVRMEWRDLVAVRWASGAFAIVGLAIFIVTRSWNPPEVIQAYIGILSDLLLAGVIALFLLQLRRKLTIPFMILLWGLIVPGRVILGMAQGAFALGIVVMSALTIVYISERRRFPWTAFLFAIAVFAVLQPVKGRMRETVFAGGWTNPEMRQYDKLEALYDTAFVGLEVADTLGLRAMVAIAAQRLDDAAIFAHVIAYTPDTIPYWHGATYKRFLLNFVPRFIYPEKPPDTPGNNFAHQYEFFWPENYINSVNVAQVMETYGNFGPIGVLVGGLIIGFVYRIVNDLFLRGGLGAEVTGMFLLLGLTDIENSAAGVFGGIFIRLLLMLTFGGSVYVIACVRQSFLAYIRGAVVTSARAGGPA